MARMMARPRTLSAAAAAMTKRAKSWPMPSGRAATAGGHEGEVHRVEDQLQRHEDPDGVLPGDRPVDAEREQERAPESR